MKGRLRRLREFLVSVREELTKVSWPSREHLIASTLIVILSVIFLAVFVGLCDVVLSWVIRRALH